MSTLSTPRHRHTWGPLVKRPDGWSVQTCTGCGVEHWYDHRNPFAATKSCRACEPGSQAVRHTCGLSGLQDMLTLR